MSNYIDLKEQLRDARREVERERELYVEKIEAQDGYLRVLDSFDELVKKNEDLNDQVEMLKEEIDSLKQQLQEKEVRLSELGKLSAGVAKKSSHDDVSKAMRIYLNTSKRKTLSKREAAKTVFLELITAAKLELPEDIMELLNHFDDENPEPQIVIEKAADVIAEGGVKNVKNGTDD
jgi:cell division septum initiation protein DivIVA